MKWCGWEPTETVDIEENEVGPLTPIGDLSFSIWSRCASMWRVRDQSTVGRLDPTGVQMELRARGIAPGSWAESEVLRRFEWIESEWRQEMVERQGEEDALARARNEFARKKANDRESMFGG